LNQLFYGDNLDVLRDHVRDETVDLIYLDPPFNSDTNYNVLFKSPTGEEAKAQIEAFEDTWHWNESAERAFDEVINGPHSDASIMLRAMRGALGDNDMMAYLAMMAVRLIELHRVLKPTGALYLHCDPTASHYLKILLDAIFGAEYFQNEIVWHYSGWNAKLNTKFNSRHDVIFYYSKGKEPRFNSYTIPWESEAEYVRVRKQKVNTEKSGKKFVLSDAGGGRRVKRYLHEAMAYGKPVDDVWDIDKINNSSKESLGYQTQKPVALLQRIVAASSNEGDLVLDPFCGCGTTIHASEKMKRQWIGIDVTHLAIALVERRLKEAFSGIVYEVHGVPKDHASARDLAVRDKHEFQKWITATIGAQPYRGGRKGMDRGIDGYMHFRDADRKAQFAVVSVKGGSITPSMVRDLKGTMEREGAALGLFLTLNDPTREMIKEAASAGIYETGGQKISRVQILTAAEILEGRRPQVPFGFSEGFAKATREEDDDAQGSLL